MNISDWLDTIGSGLDGVAEQVRTIAGELHESCAGNGLGHVAAQVTGAVGEVVEAIGDGSHWLADAVASKTP